MAFATLRRRMPGLPGTKPLTAVVLLGLAAATFLESYWPWGLLFLYWVAAGLRSGEAFLVEPIFRGRNPILFWSITAMWTGFGLWTLYADLVWRFG